MKKPTRFDSYQESYRRGSEALGHEDPPTCYDERQRRAWGHGKRDAAGSARFQHLANGGKP